MRTLTRDMTAPTLFAWGALRTEELEAILDDSVVMRGLTPLGRHDRPLFPRSLEATRLFGKSLFTAEVTRKSQSRQEQSNSALVQTVTLRAPAAHRNVGRTDRSRL